MDEDGKTWMKMERHEGRQKDTEEDGKTQETMERHEPIEDDTKRHWPGCQSVRTSLLITKLKSKKKGNASGVYIVSEAHNNFKRHIGKTHQKDEDVFPESSF